MTAYICIKGELKYDLHVLMIPSLCFHLRHTPDEMKAPDNALRLTETTIP